MCSLLVPPSPLGFSYHIWETLEFLDLSGKGGGFPYNSIVLHTYVNIYNYNELSKLNSEIKWFDCSPPVCFKPQLLCSIVYLPTFPQVAEMQPEVTFPEKVCGFFFFFLSLCYLEISFCCFCPWQDSLGWIWSHNILLQRCYLRHLVWQKRSLKSVVVVLL